MIRRLRAIRANFDRFESHIGVAALVPATPNVEAQSNSDQGGRDKPARPGRKAGCFKLTEFALDGG